MERQITHDFNRRKGWRMMWEKNKSTTPRLAFPFCLKTSIKQGNFSEKADMCFRESGIKQTC